MTSTGIQILDIGQIIIPMNKVVNNSPKKVEKIDLIKEDLISLGAPNHEINNLSKSIKLASDATNINDKIITSLMFTESNFRKKAISSKGYKGLMQTEKASFGYSEVDTLMGAKVLQEKLRISKGNLHRALALYKGGNNPQARKQASEVIKVYKTLL